MFRSPAVDHSVAVAVVSHRREKREECGYAEESGQIGHGGMKNGIMNGKDKYKILCNNEFSIPIYVRDWWLDTVCGENNWDVLLYEQKDRIEAAMPFYLPYKGIITMPDFTQTMGIWFNPEFESKKYSKNLYRKQLICKYFIENLPAHDYFFQNFHYSFTDWLPFYWKGYRQTTRYNYILPDIRNIDELWNNLSENIKRNTVKAQKKYHITIKQNISLEMFMELNRQTFERQHMKTLQPTILRKIIEVSRKRNQGDIWGAFDDQGRLHAAVFIVYQNNCAYYIASGTNSSLRKSGAHICVLWEAIKEVSKTVASFDFEGSMIEGVEYFFKSFGAIQMPYYTITKGKMSLIKKIFIRFKQRM
jgi:hypothetical protein